MIDIANGIDWPEGETCTVDLTAPTFKALMPAKYIGTQRSLQYLEVSQSYRVIMGRFDVRRKGLLRVCQIQCDGKVEAVEVYDTSLYGLGIRMETCIDPGKLVNLEIPLCPSSGAVVCASGKVVYARMDPEVDKMFRIGVELISMSRIDANRWKQIMELKCLSECGADAQQTCSLRAIA